MQFEKRFEDFTESAHGRFNRVEKKVDQIPWLLLGIVVNLVFSIFNLMQL